jgi:hypothetical protein
MATPGVDAAVICARIVPQAGTAVKQFSACFGGNPGGGGFAARETNWWGGDGMVDCWVKI